MHCTIHIVLYISFPSTFATFISPAAEGQGDVADPIAFCLPEKTLQIGIIHEFTAVRSAASGVSYARRGSPKKGVSSVGEFGTWAWDFGMVFWQITEHMWEQYLPYFCVKKSLKSLKGAFGYCVVSVFIFTHTLRVVDKLVPLMIPIIIFFNTCFHTWRV